MTVGVVGLGLMGCSLALAIKEYGECKNIVGFDLNKTHEQEALDLNIINALSPLDALISSSDLIVLAIPVEAIVQLMPSLKAIKKDAVIVDLGSTKTQIIEAIPKEIRSRFVAAHPMAGTEYSGPKAAFLDLYRDRIAVLCNTEANDQKALDLIIKLFKTIKMRIVMMNAKDHDRHAAFISHMPHAISYALANSVLSQEDKQNILTLAAGGFRDMSRLAKSSANMWISIFKHNREPLLESISVFESELRRAHRMIEGEEWDDLKVWMSKANSLHDIFKPISQDQNSKRS